MTISNRIPPTGPLLFTRAGKPLFCLGLAFLAPLIQATECTLSLAGREYACAFESPAPDSSTQRNVVRELREVLAWFEEAQVDSVTKPTHYQLNSTEFVSTSRLYLKAPVQRMVPRDLNEYFGNLVVQDGKVAVVLTQGLLKFYEDAHQRWQTYKQELAKLDTLVQKLNAPPLDWLRAERIWTMYGPLPKKHLDDVRKQLAPYRFGKLSPWAVGTDLDENQTEQVAAKVPLFDRKSGKLQMMVGFLWTENGWVMVLA